jgi:hypothetical protein
MISLPFLRGFSYTLKRSKIIPSLPTVEVDSSVGKLANFMPLSRLLYGVDIIGMRIILLTKILV